MMFVEWKKLALFAGGAVFGSAGVKLLSSKDAKKAYTHATAAVLRMKDCVMTTVNQVQENCGDILADAKDINEARVAAAQVKAEEAVQPLEATEATESVQSAAAEQTAES